MSGSHKPSRLFMALAGLLIGSAAYGQAMPEPSRDVAFPVDSGRLFDVNPAAGLGNEAQLIWATEVSVPGAPWMRVHFSTDTLLAGKDRDLGGSYLLITSVKDGEQQIFDSTALPEWDHISAFFNGDTLFVELFAAPGMGDNRVRITQVTAGIAPFGPDSICGTTDDRVPDNDARVGRLSSGCTGWLIGENGTANEWLTAGHCLTNGQTGLVMMMNVPPASSSGAFNAPPVQFQFPVQAASIRSTDGGVGNDYARFMTNNNSNTRLPAAIAQGRNWYSLAAAAPNSGTNATTVRGHGVVNNQSGITAVPWQWNRINKVHTAQYQGRSGNRINYLTDTTPANSGSPVTQIVGSPIGFEQAIGIHTHGFCPGTFNSGTAIDIAGLQTSLSQAAGDHYPFDSAVSKALSTSFASNNGGSDGGAIYFDVAVGSRSLTMTHFQLNIHHNGTSNNPTTTEMDDFFNFTVYLTPGTAVGKQNVQANWTQVATGGGMPRAQNARTIGALRNTFVLDAFTSYGVAIVFDNGAGHRYTDATGSNEVFSNTDVTITGISASNAPFTGNIAGRVWNGALGYLLNQSQGHCLETLFAQDNGLGSGSTVFFDVDVKSLPITLTRITSNVQGAGGANVSYRLYRTATTYVGKESDPRHWTLVSTASGVSQPSDTPSSFNLDTYVNLAANSSQGLALQIEGGGHAYTNGTGQNQLFENSHLRMELGSAISGNFTGTQFSPRVWNGALCYGVSMAPCTGPLLTQSPPNAAIGGFNSVPGGQEEADNFTVASNWSVTRATVWGAYATMDAPVSQNFIVRFFEESNGLPGTLVATRNINNVSPNDTGLIMAGGFNRPIYQYNLILPSAVALTPGRYWISVLGNTGTHTWAWARTNTTLNAHAVRQGAGPWNLSGGDFAMVLCGTETPPTPCYPDCDQSTGVGVLDIFDFLCFGNAFAANQPYACNCDLSTGNNVCDIFDFLCFGNEFAAGCP